MAQREALGLVSRLGEGAEVMVIEAGVQPKVLAPFTRDRARVVGAIRGAHARDLPNRLGDGVRTARALVGPDARAEIHVFTDGAHPDAVKGQGEDVRVRWTAVGSAGEMWPSPTSPSGGTTSGPSTPRPSSRW